MKIATLCRALIYLLFLPIFFPLCSLLDDFRVVLVWEFSFQGG
jgi:hypothetical protein